MTKKSKLSIIVEKYDHFKEFKSVELKDNRLVLNPLSYIGMGELHLDTNFTEDFGPSKEWFLNVFSLTWRMSNSLDIQSGFDIKSSSIVAMYYCLLEPDLNEPGRVRQRDPESSVKLIHTMNNKIRVTSYAIPLTLGMTLNKRGVFPLVIRGGCEFCFNRPGTIISKRNYYDGTYDRIVTKKWASVDDFAINYIASVSLGSIGFVFKYFPENLLNNIGSTLQKDRVYYSDYYSSIGFMLSF